MKHARHYVGPETAWYEQRLQRQRRFQLIAGVVMIVFGLCILLSGILLIPGHRQPLSFDLIIISILPMLQGGVLLLANWSPVTPQAVERLRRQERIRLFRQAQGMNLPWQYRRWVRALEGLTGLLLLLSAVQDAFDIGMPSRTNAEAWIVVSIVGLLGLLLMLDSAYIKPWRARRLAERSATELAARLSLGELVTSDQAQTENNLESK